MADARTLSIDMRPTKFSEVLGNEKAIIDIRDRLKSGRIPTAFLFSGPSGVGKTTVARIIASTIDGDLQEVNASHDTGVDAARALGDASQYRPLVGKYKVILLDEAQWLSKQAQNALLKHIEEAPDSTVWILCTTEPSKIIDTLMGRCLSYQFAGLNAEQTKTLVERGKAYLGKTTTKTEELVSTLVAESISSPRVILMALERFLGGMDPLGASLGAEGSPLALEIARATYKKDWKTVAGLLIKVPASDSISVRNIVAGYFKSVLLKGSGVLVPLLADAIVELSASVPFESGLGMAELSARLYRICHM